jgi:ribose 5-phosphate isomerase
VVATLGRFLADQCSRSPPPSSSAVTALGVTPHDADADATPFRTDQGNYVFDLACASISDPADPALRLDAIPASASTACS